MKTYQVQLLDGEGAVIQSRECEGKKAAVDAFQFLSSDSFASSCETTHKALGSSKVTLATDGEIILDMEMNPK